jgi:hypothetical protein
MKKLISFFTVALFLCFSMNSFAQVATVYTWSQAGSTYTPITGGTIVATATSNTGATAIDDVIYNLPNGTIPFTFNFNGTGYTGCNISSNGFITFGATAPTTGTYSPLSATTAYAGAIAAFAGDNIGLFVGADIGEIRYETVGSEFVIQYSNFKQWTSTATTAAPYWKWNFQIRLHSNGTVRVVYDESFVGALTTTITRQVGLRGPTNAFATNVNNRLITNGTHTWTTSVAGTTNGSLCGISPVIPNIPPSGHTYLWTPPQPVANDVRVSAASAGTPGKVLSAGKGYDVNATVLNLGTTTQNVVPVYYTVNGGSPIGPVNTVGPIVQNGSENVVFSGGNAFVPLTAGAYTLKVYTALAGDEAPGNDTTTLNLTVYDKVSSFPYVQDFTTPTGWTVFGNAVWSLSTCVNPDGQAANPAAIANFYNISDGAVLILRSPEMDFTGISNPVLDFYVAYRTYTGGESDTVRVMISTDGGLTFNAASTPYAKSWDSDPSLATLAPSGSSYIPTAASEWRHETVDLSNVGNLGNVVIGFVGISNFGNNAWVDNVIVSQPNSLCTDDVTGPGVYNCNSIVSLDFTATPLPPPAGNQNTDNTVRKTQKSEQFVSNIPSYSGDFVINSGSQFDNPNGGTAFVSQYTNNDPGQNIATNTTATAPDATISTPTNVYHDFWFTVTYDGNDYQGYATYDISIDISGTGFTIPNALYIVKRTDRTGAWVCQNTTLAGNILTVTGLTDFSDFALAGMEALPVELASFVSTINGRNVELNWATASETNNSGFDIERSSANGSWTKIANVSGNGTSAISHSYSYTDRNLASGNYSYRLKQIDFNGNFEYFNLNNEVIVGVPSNFSLSQNYPNPFNPSTKINFDLPVDGNVSLKIFDMSGKEVMTLVNEVRTAGYYSVNFNGASLSSGIYFYTIQSGSFVSTKKMTLIK